MVRSAPFYSQNARIMHANHASCIMCSRLDNSRKYQTGWRTDANQIRQILSLQITHESQLYTICDLQICGDLRIIYSQLIHYSWWLVLIRK